MRGLRLLSLIALTSPLCVATQSTAGQQANFVAGTRTVAIYATVTGASGRLVTDLQREDFEVHDNGKPQELTLFANDIQPITVVILLDRSGSMRAHFDLVERAAEEFVGAMLPADRARIGSFSNRIQIDPRDFTSDHDELLRILRNELQEEGPTPLWNAINVGITGLLRQEGRRVLLVFTDGADSPGNGRQNNVNLKDVTKRAEAENVMVYAIGLVGSNPQLGGYRRSGLSGFGGSRRGGRRREDRPDEGLLKLATATGGGYFELSHTDDLAATFKRVAEELHHQYALGFTPTNLDGKAHSLRVQVREEAATVRARKSYIASKQ
jgi:Ca-activated chloride channel family protein